MHALCRITLILACCCLHPIRAGEPDPRLPRAQALHGEGNDREAAELYQEIALDPATPEKEAASALEEGVLCYLRANLPERGGALVESALASRPRSWRLHFTAAWLGTVLGGHTPPEGMHHVVRFPSEREQSRITAMDRMLRAESLFPGSADAPSEEDLRHFYDWFASIILMGREEGFFWRLSALTDLSTTEASDASTPWPRYGAPVDGDGSPLYYPMPASWASAANDGERWRWVLGRMAASGGRWGRDLADRRLADFLFLQFGVQSAARGTREETGDETGAFAVRTLGEDETIALLATGIRRFVMPEEYNHIRIYRRLASAGTDEVGRYAQARLATIFQNRQQYHKAVSFLEPLARDGDRDAAEALANITGKNGSLEAGRTSPAGETTTLSYLFRNGRKVALTARRLDEKALLNAMHDAYRQYPATDLGSVDMRDPASLGLEVAENGGARYAGEVAAAWEVDLEPLPDYYSSRVAIELPFTTAGCYLVEAVMEGGNTSRVVLWIADLALVRREGPERATFFVADPATGRPVEQATITMLGVQSSYRPDSRTTRYRTDILAVRTDDSGLAEVDNGRLRDTSWLIAATTGDGRLAYMGFQPIWPGMGGQESRDAIEAAFIMTDRPIYRSGQRIHFKAWVATPSPARSPDSWQAAGREVPVTAINPRGEEFFEKVLITDAYGGVEDSLLLDENAPLGDYLILVGSSYHGVRFRLEEYRKPEFEVAVDAPTEALSLGDTVSVKVRASYYHGAPVTGATVQYTVTRSTFTNVWTPPWEWEWLYGPRPPLARPALGGETKMIMPPIGRFPHEPPEVVARGQGEVDGEGVVRIRIDTGPAREHMGDRDHAYAIAVEVTDGSRRTVTGSGTVVATRKPFAVTAWTRAGYARSGEDARVDFRAFLPLGAGIPATGTAVLSRLRFTPDGEGREEEVQRWSIATGPDGAGHLRVAADAPGQYRLRCTLRNGAGDEESASVDLVFRGEDGRGDFRYGALELMPDREEYQAGDTVRLAVNSSNPAATVLLFVRAERGTDAPVLKTLVNGSAVVDIPVVRADQPNFFVEALTLFDGRMHHETRQIFVPPADKTLEVRVRPGQASVSPGGRTDITLLVRDGEGRPVQAQCVITVYDKSVEYLSGGTNVGDIRARFWDWRRWFHAGAYSSLDKRPYQAIRPDDVIWKPIGVFGNREADWNEGYGPAMPRRYTRETERSGPGMDAAGSMPIQSADVSHGFADAKRAAPGGLLARAAGGEGMDRQERTGHDAGLVPAALRSDFADTAAWQGALETDGEGRASFSVDMPDTLTTWQVRVWVMAAGTRVGSGEAQFVTTKKVIVRPQPPRFLTQTDQAVLSANLHNYLPRAKTARAELVLEGGMLEPASGTDLVRTVELEAGGEARVDWLVHARRPGEARAVMRLLTDEESDAAEVRLPVIVHGRRRVEPFGGVMRGEENETVIRFRVPPERLPEQSRLELSFTPTVAGAMLEALPFLLDYPYGCTEQTLNRFLPAVAVRSFLAGTKSGPEDARAARDAQPGKATLEWRERWGDPKTAAGASLFFDDEELHAAVTAGVERLAVMQNPDGGWGWFSGPGERSWPHTTAVVVHGLAAARDHGAAIPMNVLEKGLNWLRAHQDEAINRLKAVPEAAEGEPGKEAADNTDAFVYLVLAEQGRFNPDMRDFLYRDRGQLSLTGLSMLGLALHREGAGNALAMVKRNLEQYLETDNAAGTAWLRTPARGWWWWYNSDVETQTWYLQFLTATDPRGGTASGVAKYLLRNRKNGSYWQSTRDSAYAIQALAAHAAASGEAEPDMRVTLYLDGTPVMERTLGPVNMLKDNRFILEGAAVESGEHELRLVRSGRGNLYYGGGLDVFTLEDPIAAAGGELQVTRRYSRLIREDAAADLPTASGSARFGMVENYRREALPTPLDDGYTATAELRPGDLVEVELTITAANDYEYLVFEDMKAAGLEAVELVSGYSGDGPGAYVEYRDQKVVVFVRYLPRGTHSIRYRFRAEIPGSFSALPVFGGGMYATDLFANSDEMKLRIIEKGVYGGE